jgi:glycosyltransferase involved in cell wall biosynthesis
VICTRNRARRLPQTLGALAQIRSELDWELLLVDNGSDDDTAEVILRADNCGGRLRYLFAPIPGLGAARDVAWRNARGRIIAFSDDDCYPAPDFVDAVWDAFKRRPEGCIGGRILLYDPMDYPVTIDERTQPTTLPPRSFVPAGELQGANLSLRREVLEAIGGVDPAFGAGTRFPCEDVDVVAAASWAGYSVGFDPGPVVHHHHGRRAADLQALRAAYDRGRGAYFAKYLLRTDSRPTYARAWLKQTIGSRNPRDALRLIRECRAASAYLWSRLTERRRPFP